MKVEAVNVSSGELNILVPSSMDDVFDSIDQLKPTSSNLYRLVTEMQYWLFKIEWLRNMTWKSLLIDTYWWFNCLHADLKNSWPWINCSHHTFVYSPEERDDNNCIIQAAESRFNPDVLKRKYQDLYSPRYVFKTCCLRPGESINCFVSDLMIKASACEFNVLHDELVRDWVVTGITNTSVRKQLLKESELTPAKLFKFVKLINYQNSR